MNSVQKEKIISEFRGILKLSGVPITSIQNAQTFFKEIKKGGKEIKASVLDGLKPVIKNWVKEYQEGKTWIISGKETNAKNFFYSGINTLFLQFIDSKINTGSSSISSIGFYSLADAIVSFGIDETRKGMQKIDYIADKHVLIIDMFYLKDFLNIKKRNDIVTPVILALLKHRFQNNRLTYILFPEQDYNKLLDEMPESIRNLFIENQNKINVFKSKSIIK